MTVIEPTGFGSHLKRLRLAAGLTQEALAERAGLSGKAVSDLERDPARVPRLESVNLLAEALHLDEEKRARLLEAARPTGMLSGEGKREHAPSRELPQPLTPLIGRETDVDRLVKLLLHDSLRLLTLTGPGGVGKTQLAIHVAERVASAFADGVLFGDLSPLRDPALVLALIAHQLGVRESEGTRLLSRLIDALQDKHMLLVLDNIEQVLGAREELIELLTACPGLVALLTSRVPLRVRGEQVYVVEPLPLPSETSSLEVLTQSPAVELFLQRAAATGADLPANESTLSAVAEICRRLDGLPLAIELAAAWSPLLPSPALLARLEHRLPLLVAGSADLPLRQKTMRDTIAWSYDLLDPGEQMLFRRLSIFVGGCSVGSVHAVCADAEDELAILQQLAGLVDKSLLRRRDDGGEPRLTMLEILREYGLERLQAAGELEMLGRRHAAHFLAFAEAAEPELTGRRQVESMAQLHREYDNLRAALLWARENDAAGTGLRLAGALRHFWSSSSYLSEGRRWMEEMLIVSVDDSKTSPAAQIKALVGAATLAVDQGALDEAEPLSVQSVSLARAHGTARDLVLALNTRGLWARQTGRYEEAGEHYQEALDLAQREGDRAGAATALGGLAVLTSFSGEFSTAIALADSSLELFRELGDVRSTAEALNGMALQYMMLAEYDRAESLARESLDLYRSLNDAGGVAGTLFTLATLALQRGEYQKAAPFLEESFTLREKRGDRRSAAMSLSALSAVALNRGDTVEARRLIAEALATLDRYDDPWAIAISRTLLGHVELDMAHVQQAQVLFAEAAATFLEMGNLLYLPWTLDGMAGVAAARGEWELAAQLYGAREAGHLGMTSALPPVTPSATERAMTATREALGDERFAAARARGRERPVDAMVRDWKSTAWEV